MKEITLSADEDLLAAAQERARAENTTLDEEFRRWLAEYSARSVRAEQWAKAPASMTRSSSQRHFPPVAPASSARTSRTVSVLRV